MNTLVFTEEKHNTYSDQVIENDLFTMIVNKRIEDTMNSDKDRTYFASDATPEMTGPAIDDEASAHYMASALQGANVESGRQTRLSHHTTVADTEPVHDLESTQQLFNSLDLAIDDESSAQYAGHYFES